MQSKVVEHLFGKLSVIQALPVTSSYTHFVLRW